jgi:hypothetical protein
MDINGAREVNQSSWVKRNTTMAIRKNEVRIYPIGNLISSL